MMKEDKDNISNAVDEIIGDYSNSFLTSSICVHELIQLWQIGKVTKDKRDKRTAEDIIPWLHESGIKIIYTNEQHLETMAAMPARHSDPYDRLIIAQAINDRIPVISSDGKFKDYCKYGLEFVFNKR